MASSELHLRPSKSPFHNVFLSLGVDQNPALFAGCFFLQGRAGHVWLPIMGHTPNTAGTFRKKFRKNSGKTPETLSERFLEFPSRVRLGCPKPYNSRHLRLPERFQNSLPPSTAGDASFFRIGSGEGLSELVMEFPALLGVFLTFILTRKLHSRLNYLIRKS